MRLSRHPRWLAVGLLATGWLVATGCDDDACETCAGASAATTGSGGEGGTATGEGGTSAARAYCDCMLLACHDAYHDTFGDESDEIGARSTCLAEASALPEAGMDVDAGNFVECRTHYCTLGADDETLCVNTVGGVCE